MIAVIFEVEIAEGQQASYLEAASELKPLLEQVDGFLSVERFQSLSQPNKLLSLSFFRDEAAAIGRTSQCTNQRPRRHLCQLSAQSGWSPARLWHARPAGGPCR